MLRTRARIGRCKIRRMGSLLHRGALILLLLLPLKNHTLPSLSLVSVTASTAQVRWRGKWPMRLLSLSAPRHVPKPTIRTKAEDWISIVNPTSSTTRTPWVWHRLTPTWISWKSVASKRLSRGSRWVLWTMMRRTMGRKFRQVLGHIQSARWQLGPSRSRYQWQPQQRSKLKLWRRVWTLLRLSAKKTRFRRIKSQYLLPSQTTRGETRRNLHES